MDTKLKADIAECAVTQELLKQGHNVLKPIGDRLAYDLAIDQNGALIRLQIKAAWFEKSGNVYVVDNRRTCTNRRNMKRSFYQSHEFDFAILVILEESVFYVMPVDIFISYGSSIYLVRDKKRQRPPRSEKYLERWDLFKSS
jgi:hypothetical protein